MKIEAFSHPKARDLSVPADDVLLHIPGRMTAVFDGASDSLGRRINGVPVGRLAAMAAAQSAALLPDDAFDWNAKDILNRLSRAVALNVPTNAGEGPASTTAMIALEGPSGLRMLGIGDTGFRINGGAAQISELAPDRVSIPARVALFKLFLQQGEPVDACEAKARACIGQGLDLALEEDVLTRAQADDIVRLALDHLAMPTGSADAETLLLHGLQTQFRLANAPDSPMGYGVLNGDYPTLTHAIDQFVPYVGLTSLEIFSDGYLDPPAHVSIDAWEARHASIEAADPHKISHAPAVKGSTPTAFFDDRTVVILSFGTDSS